MHKWPSKSIPAGEIERFVVDQIKCIGRDPTLLYETVAQARSQGQTQVAALEAKRKTLERELACWNGEVRTLLQQIAPGEDNTPSTARLTDLQERIRGAEQRATEVREQVNTLSRSIVDQRKVAKAMAVFDPVWDSLTPREQARVFVGRRDDGVTSADNPQRSPLFLWVAQNSCPVVCRQSDGGGRQCWL
ncbi:MAG: hypothetical protein IT427_10085 [Pirellulales bacterium]|nr:hypothetical protein [Pirellulales bacterium]